MVREFDAVAYISFVPVEDISARLSEAFELGTAPDVFMFDADMIPDLSEEKQLDDLTNRIGVSKIKTDELNESARRACLYQGKTMAVPLFTDVYMLATNRAIVSMPPQSFDELIGVCADLKDKKLAGFEKLAPAKQSLLYEAALTENGGKMLNAAKTKLTFSDSRGINALDGCVQVLKDAANESDAMGNEKAAFSVLTTSERRMYSEKYPDAEIELTPLFGFNRLQTFAVGVNASSAHRTRAFGIAEFLQGKSDKLAVLYKSYSAKKDVKPIMQQDEHVISNLLQAKPAPDLCGFGTLEQTYLPTAIDKALKGVNSADCLAEAAQDASAVIWKGKRE